ncbi:MAG: squalene--hopene cyclase [Candidatus Dormibacteraeota bacterium]|nr:squalene--hopene cyclase [Candidatus Dormibacteraeota bacterium]
MPSETLARAVDWLLERQDPAGWWTAELQTNVTMTAEHVLLLRFLGVDVAGIREGAVRHILSEQREGGTWALYYDGPADLSTTIEAYVALKVLGVDPQRGEMRRALRFIRMQGGLVEARVFTKIWMALFGNYPWDGIPSMPPEIVNFPSFLPLNLYDFACWARGTIAPLLIVITRRPVRELGVDVGEIVVSGSEPRMHRVPGSGFFWWLDHALKAYDRLPVQPGRARSRSKLVRWIGERQEADGSWGGIQPPWVYSLIALNLEGMDVTHPLMRRGLAGLDLFSLHDGGGWRLQACMSPVWDTAWVLLALRRAGLPREHPAITRAVDWLLAEQIMGGGDWQVKAPLDRCGGWAFEFENDIYPDIDDTAVVVLALLEAGDPHRVAEPVADAVRWCRAMRSKNGAWGAFDKDNTRQIVYRLPFADFGAMLDPPSEDVTAHVIEMLAAVGDTPAHPDVAPALAYLRREQRPWGSWFGRWGVNHIYGTWCVVSALRALRTGEDMVQRGARWLRARQNPDGGWGETCHSYEDESFAGVGVSSASQTAWALHALQLAGHAHDPACSRGVAYLHEHQSAGTWPEPEYTGTGFPRDFYINYHLYRHVFPTLTLAAFEETSRTGSLASPSSGTAAPESAARQFQTA